jgi:hypothetical protein
MRADRRSFAESNSPKMQERLKRIWHYLITTKNRYAPDKKRRVEIIRQLSRRESLSNEEWHRQFAEAKNIPLSFVSWFRDTCSKYFEYDLSAAIPEDRLVEDLRLFEATWSDTD